VNTMYHTQRFEKGNYKRQNNSLLRVFGFSCKVCKTLRLNVIRLDMTYCSL
jgi:hypothetical protein